MSDLIPLADLRVMSAALFRSGFMPGLKNEEQALTLTLLCQAKGLHPIEAMERYHISNGRPIMKAEAMLGEFIKCGGSVEWHERTDRAAEATFSHPKGGAVKVRWTIEQAKASGLTGSQTWAKYPRQMLHARCVSEGVRSVFPGATNGMYTEGDDLPPLSPPALDTAQGKPAPLVGPVVAMIEGEVVQPVRVLAGPSAVVSEKVPPGLSWETAKAMDALADALKAAEGWEPVYLPSGFLSPKAIREKAIAVLERHQQPTAGRDWLEPGTWDAVRALVEMGDPAASVTVEIVEEQPVEAADAAPAPAPMVDDLDEIEDPFATEEEKAAAKAARGGKKTGTL